MPNSSTKQSGKPDAIDMLLADHREVEKLFKSFEKTKEGEDEQAITDIVTTACTALKVHSQLEKEIFYPAIREVASEEELTDILSEAEVEHETIDALVEKLSKVHLKEEMYKANFTVVVEYVKHHVKEEEKEMFPKVRKIKALDLEAVGEEMSTRKQELMDEILGEEEGMPKTPLTKKSKSPGSQAAK